ncbi:MAG: S-layer homology domain-containing protein [Ruminiclostridium sp.]|nr:S-layer homology domain-containing protein [Ruminiclostridium sp.]
MKKRLLSLALVLCVTCVSIIPFTAGATRSFQDVSPEDWFYNPVQAAAKAKIITGNPDGTFAPDSTLTWAHTITFAVRVAQYNAGERVYGAADQTGRNWYDVYVNYARDHSMLGYTPSNLNKTISRAEAATIFAQVLEDVPQVNLIANNYFRDVTLFGYEYDSIYRLARAGICNGTGNGSFQPNKSFTRSEASTIVARLAGLVSPAKIQSLSAQDTTVSLNNPIHVSVIWDDVVYGTTRTLETSVNGTTDSGGYVIPAMSEGEYYSGGKRVGSHYKYGHGLTQIFFYEANGTYQIEVNNGRDWAEHFWLLEECNPRIEVTFPGKETIVITNSLEHFHRAPTGIWFYSFALDHGSVVSYYPYF